MATLKLLSRARGKFGTRAMYLHNNPDVGRVAVSVSWRRPGAEIIRFSTEREWRQLIAEYSRVRRVPKSSRRKAVS